MVNLNVLWTTELHLSIAWIWYSYVYIHIVSPAIQTLTHRGVYYCGWLDFGSVENKQSFAGNYQTPCFHKLMKVSFMESYQTSEMSIKLQDINCQ